MATVSERSKEVATKLDVLCDRAICQPCHETLQLIEQALLAERRLAMEEAAKIADIICGATWTAYKMGPRRGDLQLQGESDGAALVSKELRAAAEKEVGAK